MTGVTRPVAVSSSLPSDIHIPVRWANVLSSPGVEMEMGTYIAQSAQAPSSQVHEATSLLTV